MSFRELAYQIAEQFRVLGKPLGLKECIVVGGMGKYIYHYQLERPVGYLKGCFLHPKNPYCRNYCYETLYIQ